MFTKTQDFSVELCWLIGKLPDYRELNPIYFLDMHLCMQMSSAAGKTPAPGQAVYSASKYALNGYFHTLRSEVCF
jgi:hypothetical protein